MPHRPCRHSKETQCFVDRHGPCRKYKEDCLRTGHAGNTKKTIVSWIARVRQSNKKRPLHSAQRKFQARLCRKQTVNEWLFKPKKCPKNKPGLNLSMIKDLHPWGAFLRPVGSKKEKTRQFEGRAKRRGRPCQGFPGNRTGKLPTTAARRSFLACPGCRESIHTVDRKITPAEHLW